MSTPTKTSPALELKGSLLSLLILQLFEEDNEKIAEQLTEKVNQAPDFFQQVPIVIDLHAVQSASTQLDLPRLVNLLRRYGLIPVAIRGGNPQQHASATQLALGILSPGKVVRSLREPTLIEPAVTATPEHSDVVSTKIIVQPVRSGQQIVAPVGDLVVLAAVSPGAEILAERHIHVYGALRGRALAGINGDNHARIFCQHFDAELVSIAGHYQINEEIADDLRGRAIHIFLEKNSLKIEAFDTYSR